MNKIFLDIETTGLPTTKGFNNYYHPENHGFYDSSRIVSIGWIILKDDKYVRDRYFVIKPTDFDITNAQFHGITNEIANSNGIDFNMMMNVLDEDLDNMNEFWGYNTMFDYNVLLSELYRIGNKSLIRKLGNLDVKCVMKMAYDMGFTKDIKTIYGLKKGNLKLIELYSTLFDKGFKAHNALEDIKATVEVYNMLKKLNK